MSREHPIVAATGSSGAGTTTVKEAFEHIFVREELNAIMVGGDSFHRYNREEMRIEIRKAEREGRTESHFGQSGNLFGKLSALFESYGKDGTGLIRHYVRDEEEAEAHGVKPGEFTVWEHIKPGSDLLFYEGLHGGVVTDSVNIAAMVDLLVGVVPIVNLEWIQKIHRDNADRGYSEEAIVDAILRRMPDYVKYITPQFSRTHINFQRVPTVDTSNPFVSRDIPTLDESFVIIHFSKPDVFGVDFNYLLNMIHDSFMSRRDTIVVPGGKMGLAMELILTPIIAELMTSRT